VNKFKLLVLFFFILLTIISNGDSVSAISDSKEITFFKLGPENASWNGWWWDESGEEELDAQIPHGTIDGTNITVELPYGIPVTQLIPTISITGVSVSPASGVAQDFTNPVIYTVTAEDNSTQEYKVTATNHPNPAREITLFSLIPPGSGQENDGVITGTNIAITVPYGTNVTALAPTGINITGASVTPASGVPQDFTNPVIYTVTADDGSTREYTVTVVVTPSSDLTVLSALIIEAQSKHDTAIEGNLNGQYPAPLKANLQTAITTASAITGVSTQSVVDEAVETLTTAIGTFEAGVAIVITAPPITIIQNSGGGGGGGRMSYVPPQTKIVPPTITMLPVVVPAPTIQVPIIKTLPRMTAKVTPPKKVAKQVQKPNIPQVSQATPLPPQVENNLSASAASAPASSAFMSFFIRLFRWFR
jgi:hypothetical protein